MKYLLIVLMLLSVGVFAQKTIGFPTETLFSSETTTADANGAYYLTLTNADTATSDLQVFSNEFDGSGRISAIVDTTSGTTKVYFEMGLKVGAFGTDARDYTWNMLDSIEVAEEGAVQTWELPDYNWYDSAVEGYKVRVRQAGTQVNRVYVNDIKFYPND